MRAKKADEKTKNDNPEITEGGTVQSLNFKVQRGKVRVRKKEQYRAPKNGGVREKVKKRRKQGLSGQQKKTVEGRVGDGREGGKPRTLKRGQRRKEQISCRGRSRWISGRTRQGSQKGVGSTRGGGLRRLKEVSPENTTPIKSDIPRGKSKTTLWVPWQTTTRSSPGWHVGGPLDALNSTPHTPHYGGREQTV